MFRSTGNFDKLLDKATSNLLMEPDWPSILQLSDLIRQNDIQPKYALGAIKKKLSSPNQHSALYALVVLESMVKNCGPFFHEELATRAFCDSLSELARTTTHDAVRAKLLELIQAWNYAFRKNPKFGALKDIMAAMKADGYKFPSFCESDAMFTADIAPEWADGDVCHRCRVTFSMLQRKHHCRACGQVFCSQCTSKTTILPKYGFEKEVRVCDACFSQATKPASSSTVKTEKDSDLPLEYVNSSLAQQSQAPPRKSEDELREEEELELALAISQSEAEAKEKEKFKSSYSTAPVLERAPTTPPEEPATNPEMARYLNRSYWESKSQTEVGETTRAMSPSAPSTEPKSAQKVQKENGVHDPDLEDFINTLKSQVEIFINRMKSNSSRGRSITNDTSVQTLFMNITAMHSKLLRYIQQHDDNRLHYERLQDKLTQVKDARAALDDLREEHRDKLRRDAEEADRQRQLQMAHKLEIMRKKKQEYLQYQRQLALQRIQEQEREMQMRQEHQKQQYLQQYMSGQFPANPNGVPPMPQQMAPQPFGYQYAQGQMPQMMAPPPAQFAPQPNYAQMRPAITSQPIMGMSSMVMQAPAPPQHPVVPPNQPPQPPKEGNGSEAAPTAELISFD